MRNHGNILRELQRESRSFISLLPMDLIEIIDAYSMYEFICDESIYFDLFKYRRNLQLYRNYQLDPIMYGIAYRTYGSIIKIYEIEDDDKELRRTLKEIWRILDCDFLTTDIISEIIEQLREHTNAVHHKQLTHQSISFIEGYGGIFRGIRIFIQRIRQYPNWRLASIFFNKYLIYIYVTEHNVSVRNGQFIM